MDEHLSTKELGWILGRSTGTVRDMIRDGEIEGVRIPDGFRIPEGRGRARRARADRSRGRSQAVRS